MSENGNTPELYLIPAELVVGLLTYLGGRPYSEVANAMATLQALEPFHSELIEEKS